MEYLNVHISLLYILAFTVISTDHGQKQTHLFNDHKNLFEFFCSCSIHSVFNRTSLPHEAYNTGLQNKNWEDAKQGFC